ncbi:hypothetical protein BS78_04G188800 [Paspalum vaginatum]|nr:hypothetical protein BS78_04G188800 [Paspalum vaginatum]
MQRPFSNKPRPRVVQAATASREKPARRDDKFAVASSKQVQVDLATSGRTGKSVHPALRMLRKRMSEELDALRALLGKAELLSRSKNGTLLPAEQRKEAASSRSPAAKRMKVSPSGKVGKECDPGVVLAREEIGLVDISPVVVCVKKTEEPGNRKRRNPPEDEDEDELVDICGGVSPIAFQETVLLPVEDDGETGSSPSSSSSSSSSESESSPSSSESDSDSDSDKVENVDSPPAPPVFVPEEKSTAAQPLPELLASVPMQNTELEEIEQLQSDAPKKVQDVQRVAPAPKAVSMPGLIYRAKLRLALLEMERAALPDESIHARELQCLGIVEHGRPSVMRKLGLFLKAN